MHLILVSLIKELTSFYSHFQVLFYFLFVLSTKPLLGHPGRFNADCLQSANRDEFKRIGTENYLGDIGSSPQETRIFDHVSSVDKERKNIKIKNMPMAMEFPPFYLKSNINNEKRSMFGYKYDIVFPRKGDIQRKYEVQQEDKISTPINPVSIVEASGEDEYHSKSSNRLESFHYNSLSSSVINRNEYAKTDGKASDSNHSEPVYFEENSNNANGNTSIEATTVDDGIDTTPSAYPNATEINEPYEINSDGVGYRYEKPAGDKQFLLHTNVSQQETSVEGDREQSPSASSVREKIEYPGSPRDDLDIGPRVSVIFQSSNFAEDGIPLADDNENNSTVSIAFLFRII